MPPWLLAAASLPACLLSFLRVSLGHSVGPAVGWSQVDVVLSKGAWVRKPRGAKPGAVMVTRELRNVVGRPGDSVAARAGEQVPR